MTTRRVVIPPAERSGADFPETIEVVVEIPRGLAQQVRVRRADGRDPAGPSALVGGVLPARVRVRRWHAGRGRRPYRRDHPLDEPTFPGCQITARPVGVLLMHDDKGPDEKILCVAIGDPHWAHVRSLADVVAAEAARGRALLRDLQAARGQDGRDRWLGRRRSREGAAAGGSGAVRGRGLNDARARAAGGSPARRPTGLGGPPALHRGPTVRSHARPWPSWSPASRRARRARAPARRPGAAVRWVRMDGLHLTLRYVGPVADEERCPSGCDPGGGCARGARSTSSFRSPARSRTRAGRGRFGSVRRAVRRSWGPSTWSSTRRSSERDTGETCGRSGPT